MADDESWLYGDESKDAGDIKTEPGVPPTNDETSQDANGVDDETADAAAPAESDATKAVGDDDDSDDDDDVEITIDQGKIEEAKTTYQTFGLNKQPLTRQPPSEKKGKFSVEDFDQIGTVNGAPAQDVEIENIEDKPWRKPGADITDYFNYGFTEETWQAYCNRQRKLRLSESGAGMPGTTIVTKPYSQGVIPTLGAPKQPVKYQPQQVVQMSVPTVGAKPENSTISVMTSDKREYSKKVIAEMDFSVPPPGIGPPGVPPPGIPPTIVSGPPPGFQPPPDEFPADDPFGQGPDYDFYSGGYEPTAENQWQAPPPGASSQQWSASDGDGPPGESGQYEDRGWKRRSSRDNSRDRSASRSRSEYERKRRRSRSRERGDRYRERSERRDRDRDRDREREQRRSERERREKSRSRSPSHRHKKSKKEKKEKPEREEEK